MGIPTPIHFRDTAQSFAVYIVECAIRDRITWLEAMSSCDDEESSRYIQETEEEIRCMRKHEANLQKNRKRAPAAEVEYLDITEIKKRHKEKT